MPNPWSWRPWEWVVSTIVDTLSSNQPSGVGSARLAIVVVGPPGSHPTVTFSEGGTTVAATDLGDAQHMPLAVSEKDTAGNPVSVPSPDTWSSSDTTIVTVAADPSDPSGLNGVVRAVGKVGTATVTVDVRVTNPDGTTSDLTASLDVNVVPGPAAAVAITPGTPINN